MQMDGPLFGIIPRIYSPAIQSLTWACGKNDVQGRLSKPGKLQRFGEIGGNAGENIKIHPLLSFVSR